MKIFLDNVTKIVNEKELIFRNVSYSFECGKKYSIIGPNGSGKSTLLRLISSTIRPTSGKITYSLNDKNISSDKIHNHYGYVAPYLNIYEELMPLEHIKIVAKIRKIEYNNEIGMQLLKDFNLDQHHSKPIRFFSSGMKQRMKFLLATIHKPSILLLDEPFTNLDDKGIEIFTNYIDNYTKNGILIVASNDIREISLTEFKINLLDYK